MTPLAIAPLTRHAIKLTETALETWGYANEAMYIDRWALVQGHLPTEPFVLVDWGSDSGWFSLQVARKFRQSTIVSVEAGIMTAGRCLKEHRSRMEEFDVSNNILVETLFGAATFEQLRTVPSDVQLVLSVFHHMGDGFGRYLRAVQDWDTAFCDLVEGSNVTFFEVPNERSPTETPHGVRKWYRGRDVATVIEQALDSRQVRANIELLGETEHGDKGARKLFKITLDQPAVPAPVDAITKHIRTAGATIRITGYRKLRIRLAHLRERIQGRW